MSTATLVVSEVFGPTVQGEGPSTGRRCAFVRLGACNLTCSWCDTPYTWDASRYDLRDELTRRPVDAILRDLADMGEHLPLVVISGGEPLLQQEKGLVALLWALRERGQQVEVETNGTITPTPGLRGLVTRFNVSPKLAHSGVSSRRRIRPETLRRFAFLASLDEAAFKFVCTSVEDLDEVEAIVKDHDIDRSTVWIMPEGTTVAAIEDHMVVLADEAIRRGFNLTQRLHVAIWNGERAR